MSFAHIIGNEQVKTLISKTVQSNNILHSYMFIGQDGIGKSLFAKEFAKMILCQSPKNESKALDNCKSCIEFQSNNHPDFLTICPADGKSIKIEQIRYLQEKIAEKPIISDNKVYIIQDSDYMTKEAQNCLLKTLEEPPEYAVIILVLSNENKLLNTIKSRCTKIHFSKLSNHEILAYFQSIGSDIAINSPILKVCNGSIGKALKLKNEATDYEQLDTIISNFDTKDIIDIWNNSELLYKSKDNIQDLLEYMNVVFMDKLLYDYNVKYINAIKCVETAKNRLTANANYDMCIDNLLLKIWENYRQ